jgi:hypothetical protein
MKDDPNQTNGDNLNSIRLETSRHLRKKKREYTGCPRRNVPDFGRVFLMLKHTDITQNTYVQS